MADPSSSPSRQLTVVDVYDLAAEIGHEFEQLIALHGPDSFRQLMPKVISALETLEAFAGNNERDNEQVITLNKQVERLEQSRTAAISARDRYELELEHLEDLHRQDLDKLQSEIKQLQKENRRLHRQCADDSDGNSYASPAASDEENSAIQRLQQALREQRDTNQSMRSQVEQLSSDLQTCNDDLDKWKRLSEENQRQCAAVKHQARLLVEERSTLAAQLQKAEEDLIETRHQLNEAKRAALDSEQLKIESGDEDRANKPRFTLAELRQVLNERNELKARVMQLEEQIEEMKTTPAPVKEEDLVVYGPLPREPDEKLQPWKYKRPQSGVRKLFGRLWSSGISNASFDSSVVLPDLPSPAEDACELGTDPASVFYRLLYACQHWALLGLPYQTPEAQYARLPRPVAHWRQ